MKAPKSICLLNDSFPPLIDGVANTVVNYAQELTKLGDRAIVVTPEHPEADDSRFSLPQCGYPAAVRVSCGLSLFPGNAAAAEKRKGRSVAQPLPGDVHHFGPVHPGGGGRTAGVYISHKIRCGCG